MFIDTMITYFFGKFVRVPAIRVHLSNGLRNTTVAEEVHELVDALLISNVEAAMRISLCVHSFSYVH